MLMSQKLINLINLNKKNVLLVKRIQLLLKLKLINIYF